VGEKQRCSLRVAKRSATRRLQLAMSEIATPPARSPEAYSAATRLTIGALFDFGRRGYLAFLMCVVVLSFAAAATRKYWAVAGGNAADHRRTVAALLVSLYEPRASVERGAVVSLAIELGYVDPRFSCLGESRGGVRCDEMAMALRAWGETIEREANGGHLADLPAGTGPCSSDDAHLWVQRANGPGLCARARMADSYLRGVLSVSPFSFDCEGGTTRLNAEGENVEEVALQLWKCLTPRARRAVVASDAIDEDVGSWLGHYQFQSAGLGSEPVPVQVFFLAPQGVLRRWVSGDPDPTPLLDDFRGRDYVNGTRSGGTPFELGVYLDQGGHGLVRTFCHRAMLDGAVVGVICVDYLPPAGVPDSSQEVVTHARVDVREGASREISADGLSHADQAAIARRLRGETNLVAVLDVDEAEPPLFLVPLAAKGAATSFVALRPAAPTLPWTFWTMVAALGVALVTTVYAVAMRRREFNLEDEYTILRKLQVGIIRANAHNEILEANDCAEELLGVELPPLGARQKRGLLGDHDVVGRGVPFSSFFDSGKVRLMTFNGPDEGGMKAPRFEDCSIAEVDEGRSAGAWSRYYLKKRDRRGAPDSRWLGLVGSPLLGASSQSGESFAIVVVPSTGRREELERL
jgi:hypothetical protein